MTLPNLRNFLFVLVAVASICLPARAQEYEKECDEDNPALCSQPLMEGQIAPFSGQLLTTELAITLGQKAAYCETRIKLEVEFVKEKFELDINLEKKLHEIDNEACDEKVELLTERLKDAKIDHWYQHPLFVSTVSVVLTTGLFIAGAYAYNAVAN